MSSAFWRLPVELRNQIYELAYDVEDPVEAIVQKLSECILDVLLVSKQWYQESLPIFLTSREFKFESFEDLVVGSKCLSPHAKKNVVSISWRQQTFHDIQRMRVCDLVSFYPNVKSIRIFVFRWCLDWYKFDGKVASRDLLSEADLTRAWGSSDGHLHGLRSVRGLESFSWVPEGSWTLYLSRCGKPASSECSVFYDLNWEAISKWTHFGFFPRYHSRYFWRTTSTCPYRELSIRDGVKLEGKEVPAVP